MERLWPLGALATGIEATFIPYPTGGYRTELSRPVHVSPAREGQAPQEIPVIGLSGATIAAA